MAWLVLIAAGTMEAVWAIALDKSDGFSRVFPSLVFVGALAASMAGLGYAMRAIPIGTSYAVWVGVGASLTVLFAMATGTEPISFVRILFLFGLISCIIGLKMAH